MKKIKGYVSIFLLAIIFTCFFNTVSFADDKSKVILIDPGHGGVDGGASSKAGVLEKDINLSVGLRLKKILEESGYTVHMTVAYIQKELQ